MHPAQTQAQRHVHCGHPPDTFCRALTPAFHPGGGCAGGDSFPDRSRGKAFVRRSKICHNQTESCVTSSFVLDWVCIHAITGL